MSILCKICKNDKFKIILNKKKTEIFTNSEDSKKNIKKFLCRLYQCLNCNFVFQIPSSALKKDLTKIYLSNQAQISQPLGEGNWGQARFLKLKTKLKNISLYKKKNILELACGNGYLLKYLSHKGFLNLYGIDPSANTKINNKGIKLIKKFATKKLKLNYYFDFIFSVGLYEHAYNINDLTKFSINHLSAKGQILVIIPNFFKSLKNGNPDLFAHEHINYFTKKSIIRHFSNYNLKKINDYSDEHTLALYFTRDYKYKYLVNKSIYISKIANYNYEQLLEKNLNIIFNSAQNHKLIIHGACNSLNNILSWTIIKNNFLLVDNDMNKIGKFFFGKKIQDINNINLLNYNIVVIIPTHFSQHIKKNYVKKGFNGKFVIFK